MSDEEKKEVYNEFLNKFGSPVADGMATRWADNGEEIYRDNVGRWIKYILDGVVKWDSRGVLWLPN